MTESDVIDSQIAVEVDRDDHTRSGATPNFGIVVDDAARAVQAAQEDALRQALRVDPARFALEEALAIEMQRQFDLLREITTPMKAVLRRQALDLEQMVRKYQQLLDFFQRVHQNFKKAISGVPENQVDRFIPGTLKFVSEKLREITVTLPIKTELPPSLDVLRDQLEAERKATLELTSQVGHHEPEELIAGFQRKKYQAYEQLQAMKMRSEPVIALLTTICNAAGVSIEDPALLLYPENQEAILNIIDQIVDAVRRQRREPTLAIHTETAPAASAPASTWDGRWPRLSRFLRIWGMR